MKRGTLTIDDLRARSTFDARSLCWHWNGAKAGDGVPRIWTLDHARCDKRTMTGPAAVWNIAHGCAPRPGWLVFRRCGIADCVNPAHHLQAPDRAAIGRFVANAGFRKGKNVEVCRANIAAAHAAQGLQVTPDDVVLAIRAADRATTNRELAARLNITHQTVSKIRRGESRRQVAGAA